MPHVAMISVHTSPLLQPGAGDSGGMNVYVREVGSALAQAGVECTTYTRADRPGLPAEVQIEPGHRVVHVPAGPFELPKEALADELEVFTARVGEHLTAGPDGGADVIHGNYWLSGMVGHRLKHALDVPLVSTFHTLARVKAEGGDLEPSWRDQAEAEIIGCSDVICVSCPEEERQFRRLYGDPAGRIEVVPPAVEHAFFAPGDRTGARRAVGLPADRPIVLFVGRIQPLKAPDVAVAAMAHVPDALLVVIGGASGPDGEDEVTRVRQLVAELDLTDRVQFIPPRPHHILSSYYRAADVVIVPSRSESFGLVALEAAACGIPVVASAVGGLLNIVHDGVTGLLVEGRDPARFGRAIREVLNDPVGAAGMGAAAAVRARRFTWGFTAARLRRIYADLASRPARELVACT
ncbi:D-inositol-3-phosphate glycosyltransferase [soil metagenome]